jgi:acyl carrier protein
MPEIANRLINCFAAVFPGVPQDRIPTATQESVKEWDSVAQITLLTLIDEEFGITTDIAEAEDLTSFRAFFDYVGGRVPGA